MERFCDSSSQLKDVKNSASCIFDWIINMPIECYCKGNCVSEPDFPEKNVFAPKNWEKGPKMGLKQGFEFIEKLGC